MKAGNLDAEDGGEAPTISHEGLVDIVMIKEFNSGVLGLWSVYGFHYVDDLIGHPFLPSPSASSSLPSVCPQQSCCRADKCVVATYDWPSKRCIINGFICLGVVIFQQGSDVRSVFKFMNGTLAGMFSKILENPLPHHPSKGF